MTTTVEIPYQIYMSSDPFEDFIEVLIDTKDHHPSMGLVFTTNTSMGYRSQLQECLKSTPAARIPKWRSTLRGSFPTEIYAQKIATLQDVDKAVCKAREDTKINIVCKFSIIDKIVMRPQQGAPILYNDQLNIVATHIA